MEKFSKIVLYDFESGSFEEDFLNRLRRFTEKLEVIKADGDYTGALKSGDLEDAEALITRVFDEYSDEMFENNSLEYIGTTHTDASHFDNELLDKNYITLTNVPAYATEAVAELTLAMMLGITRETKEAIEYVEEGDWGFEPFLGRELKGKKLGIIGLGKIGGRVAELAEAFGMEISHYSGGGG